MIWVTNNTKNIKCKECGKIIGIIEYDAEIVFPRCKNCATLFPEGDDIFYSINKNFH